MSNIKKLLATGLIGEMGVYLDYLVSYNNKVLAASFFERSEHLVKAVGARFASGTGSVEVAGERGYYQVAEYREEDRFLVAYETIPLGRDNFCRGVAVSSLIRKNYLISTEEGLSDAFYEQLMNNFDLPLLREWMPYIVGQAKRRYCLDADRRGGVNTSAGDNRPINIGGKIYPIGSVRAYRSSMTQEVLEDIVSSGLKKGDIRISRLPSRRLEFETFDDYINVYGKTLVSHLEEDVKPLIGLEPSVKGVALKKKRLYPQQSCCVNGVKALLKSGVHFAYLEEGMGVGKTIQALAVAEGFFNELWLSNHPGKTLKDCFESGEVAYRLICMCPGHLVEKWKAEAEAEIPGLKAYILNDLSQLVSLREDGPARSGKELYICSKDFAKLESSSQPVPSAVKTKKLKGRFCRSCYRSKDHRRVYPSSAGQMQCPECGGSDWGLETVSNETFRGLICPCCGELLHKYSPRFHALDDESLGEMVLSPADFAHPTGANAVCENCGEVLWTVKAANKTYEGPDAVLNRLANREAVWYKVSHWANRRKKNRDTAWVLKGHEYGYLLSKEIPAEEFKKLVAGEPTEELAYVKEQKVRKVSPARFIKRYLKGYFDFFIADEVHKYAAEGSAQAIAFHALNRASKFTLCLTGTISNGTASSLFPLMFRLDPKKMLAEGFKWGDTLKFAKLYGCIETVYEHREGRRYNSNSRGSVITPARVKPGVSPLLYVKFLLDRAVQLDLSDLSQYIPPLHEYVRIVECETPVKSAYDRAVDCLKEASQSGEGMGAMSEMLNFALSYTDKPWGRLPIVSAKDEEDVICVPENFDEYRNVDVLTKKEQSLIELVNDELSEGRNCFVYASFTGKEEMNITQRLKDILERHCGLSGQVFILESGKGKASDREKWIRQRAARGMRVCICNPKCVETGLDFCFTYEGRDYNYPTLIYYQTSYELATVWQASRRAYRLNQTVECRTYYFATEATLQSTALEIMAAKQQATAAIQGKFSVDGLAQMSKTVDARVKLAQALSSGDTSDRKSIENMFDVMNASVDAEEDAYADIPKALLYSEVMGVEAEAPEEDAMDLLAIFDEMEEAVAKAETPDEVAAFEGDMFSMFELFSAVSVISIPPASAGKKGKKKRTAGLAEISEFDFFSMLA